MKKINIIMLALVVGVFSTTVYAEDCARNGGAVNAVAYACTEVYNDPIGSPARTIAAGGEKVIDTVVGAAEGVAYACSEVYKDPIGATTGTIAAAAQGIWEAIFGVCE